MKAWWAQNDRLSIQADTGGWNTQKVPQDWKDASMVALYIKKGDRKDCGSYRGISLLSIVSNIFSCVVLNRLNPHMTPKVLPESQCGFRSGRSTMDMVFCLRQLQEKCTEQNMPLYLLISVRHLTLFLELVFGKFF